MSSEDDSVSSVEEIISMRPITCPRPRATVKNVDVLVSGSANGYDSGVPPTARETFYAESDTARSTKENTIRLGLFPPIISLNVGGVFYMTRLSTLVKYSDSMLAALFSGRYQVDQDKEGNYFLDSNGMVFGHILEYLRYGTLPPNDQTVPVYRDAGYYGLHSLADKLRLKPEIASITVKESHRAQFPQYYTVKDEVIRCAIANAAISKVGDVLVHAFRSEFKPKVQNFNPKHECVVEKADVIVGPWDSQADEETFIRCLEMDLMEDGYNVKPHENKRKCKYYYGQTCQKFLFKIQIIFE